MTTPNLSNTPECSASQTSPAIEEHLADDGSRSAGAAEIVRYRNSDRNHAYTATSGWLSFTVAACTLALIFNFVGWLVEPSRFKPQQSGAVPSSSPRLRFQIDVNSATSAQLQALPDIGPTLAGRIVSTRETLGRFETPEDLLAVRGFGPSTLESLRDMLSFASPSASSSTIQSQPRGPAEKYSASSSQVSSR